jgi:hypothetical protein
MTPNEKQAIMPVCAMDEQLAIAQQAPRDFLTAERGSDSVKG